MVKEYIEREDAVEATWRVLNGLGYSEKHNDRLVEEVDAVLNEYPAADVRPVVRAHWYWDKDGMDWGIGAWRCSECHARPETWWKGDSTNPRNKSGHYFCPNCGAMMEGNNG